MGKLTFRKGGSDKVTNSGAGIIHGDIRLGGGNDSYTGNNSAEVVWDEAGDDSYSLGGGNDVYINTANSGTDKVDGGAGYDVYAVSTATSDPLNINLGTAGALGVAAKTALFGSTGSETVTGFEEVDGTAYGDKIIGGAIAENLYGNDGDDIIAGGGGADKLWGGAGSDTFVLLSAKDSGTLRAGTDTIMDFISGTDKLDFSAIDADTKTAGLQHFDGDIIDNGAFTGSAGELRYVWQGGQTIVQGDTNGDKKADFQVALQGTISLQAGDIVGLTI